MGKVVDGLVNRIGDGKSEEACATADDGNTQIFQLPIATGVVPI